MKCKKCGNEVPAGSVYCMYCGNELVKKKVSKEKKEIKVPEPKQLPSGNWFIRMRVGDYMHYITKPTYEEAKAEAVAIKCGAKKAKKPVHVTLGSVIDKYINSNENVLSPSTLKSYRSYRNNRFQSVIDKEICKIHNWQDVIKHEMDCGIEAKTLVNAWRLITASMNAGHIEVPDVNLPKIAKTERNFLDYEDIITLVNVCRGSDAEIGILLGLHSLRRSEILAFTAEDIDRKNKILHVKKSAVVDSHNNIVIKNTTKTEESSRDIPIMIDRLLEITEGRSGRLVDCNVNWLYRRVNTICRQNGLPEVGVHGLRHSFASLAYHLKWTPIHTMEVGGWSDYRTVQKIYTHLAKKDQNKDVSKMKKFYDKNSGK